MKPKLTLSQKAALTGAGLTNPQLVYLEKPFAPEMRELMLETDQMDTTNRFPPGAEGDSKYVRKTVKSMVAFLVDAAEGKFD